MLDEAVAELASRQYGLFSRAQVLVLGVTLRMIEGRLRAGRWLLVLPGVYSLPGMAPSWRRDLMAACLQAGPGAVVSHEAAAALHRVDTFVPGPVVVTVAHGDHQHLRTGRLRQSTDLAPHHCTVVDGIPVTTPGRTFVDLAAHTHPGRLRICWHTRERDFVSDRRRDREAQLAGWDVYRFTWDDLRTCPEDVVATVRRALALSSK